MRKRDIVKRIEALERRVVELEALELRRVAKLGAQRTGPFYMMPRWPDPYTYTSMLLEDRNAYAG